MSVVQQLSTDFRYWLDLWCQRRSREVGQARYKADMARVQRYILPTWGRRNVARISRDQVEDWVRSLLDEHEVGKSTVYASLMILRQVLDLPLLDARVIRENPARGVPVTGESRDVREPGNDEILSWSQIRRIYEHMDPWYRTLVLLAAETGGKWDELVGLRIDDIFLDEGLVSLGHVRVVETLGRTEVADDGKVRLIPISPELVAALREHLTLTEESRATQPFVFVTKRDHRHPLRSNFNFHVWRPALRAANIPERAYTFHNLRYSAGVHMIEQGVEVDQVAKYLGHGSAITTQKMFKRWIAKRGGKVVDITRKRAR